MSPEELKVFQESVDRYQALPEKERAALRYAQRTPEASRRAAKYLDAMLHRHEGSFTRTYPAVREDGRATFLDTIVAADGVTILGFVDDHFLCPPFCG